MSENKAITGGSCGKNSGRVTSKIMMVSKREAISRNEVGSTMRPKSTNWSRICGRFACNKMQPFRRWMTSGR